MSRYPRLALTVDHLAELEDAIFNDESEYRRLRALTVFQWLHVYQDDKPGVRYIPNVSLNDETYALIVAADPGAPVLYSDVLRDRVEQETGMCFAPEEFDELLLALGGKWGYYAEGQGLAGYIPMVDDEFSSYDPLSGQAAD